MNDMKPFDIIDAPLSGTNLIEASAGTGKTYTITGLYLRLIVEKHLSVDQILLVTFTKAATEELKQRIRSRLLEARKAFKTGRSDDLMLDRIVRNNSDGKTALERIKDAIRDFDVCAIFTIHGFCQRVLHENAFETGSLFDTELVTNQQGMLRSLCQDFWRQMLYEASPEFIGFTLSRLKSPDKLLSLFNKSKDSGLRVIPQVEKPLLNSLEPFRVCGQRLAEIFPKSKIDVKKLLMDSGLNANSYGSLKPGKGKSGMSPREVKVNRWLASVDAFCNHQPLRFPLFKDFDKLSAATIQKKTKKGHEPVRHPFFEQCETLSVVNQNLLSEMGELLLFHKTEFFRFAKKQLTRLKKDRNVQYFDDLLVRLKEALEKKDQNLLAASVRNRFRAALVDEFQDTDMIQYSIFARLFSGENNLLFMIGDPKQAIYGFRGADIFSYLKASSDTKRRYTLQTNYRSSVGLITAVNTIFSQVQNPFVFDAIPFIHSNAADNAHNRNDKSSGSFQLWFTDSGEEKPQNKTDAVQRISRAMTGEINRLIHEPENLKPGDIAVLVRTNLQADIVKQHLSDRKIPAVVYSAGNVFETREARDLFLLLLGISDPFNPGRFRAALATSLMGITADVLDLEGDTYTDQAFQLKHFLDYRRIWQKDGFMRMFNHLLAQEKVRVRLLGMELGERRLTNVLHLAELLHTCAEQNKLCVEGLLN